VKLHAGRAESCRRYQRKLLLLIGASVQYGGKGPDAEYSSAELKQVFTTAASLQTESAVNIG
jgi:hypothetical protein